MATCPNQNLDIKTQTQIVSGTSHLQLLPQDGLYKGVFVQFSLLSTIRRLRLSVLPLEEKYQRTEVLTNLVRSTQLLGNRPVLCSQSQVHVISFISGIQSLATASCFQCLKVLSQGLRTLSDPWSQRFWWSQSSVLSIAKSLAVSGVHWVLIHNNPESLGKYKDRWRSPLHFEIKVVLKDYVWVGAWQRTFTSWWVRGRRET